MPYYQRVSLGQDHNGNETYEQVLTTNWLEDTMTEHEYLIFTSEEPK